MNKNKNNLGNRPDDDLPPPNSKSLSGGSSSENDDTELWRKIVGTAEIRADARLAQQQEVRALHKERDEAAQNIKDVERHIKRIKELELKSTQLETAQTGVIPQENDSRWMPWVICVFLLLVACIAGVILMKMSDARDSDATPASKQGRIHP